MKLSEFKKYLNELEIVTFELENGTIVPMYAHITEVGKLTRDFVDCGGVVRKEETVNIQLWVATDYEHRLTSKKVFEIIAFSEKIIGNKDLEIEIEYQQETISKYGLKYNNGKFVLTSTLTTCLAPDACGVPEEKTKIKIADIANESCCSPSEGCC